jgi:hypothetical protein
MHIKKSLWLGCALACGASMASAQTTVDKTFSTVSESCDGIRWSDRAMQTYPTIADACQSVEVREGKHFVKFTGKVKRNVDRGKQLVVNFKDGGDMTLTPPPETAVYIDGRRTPVASLRSGDELTFYISEDRLAAQFPETDATTTRYAVAPIVRTQAVEEEPERVASLPSTGGFLPLVGLGGCLSLGLAALLTLFRRNAR